MSEQIVIKDARSLIKASPQDIDNAVNEVCEMTAVAADINEELTYLEEAVEQLVKQKRTYDSRSKRVRSKLINAANLLR